MNDNYKNKIYFYKILFKKNKINLKERYFFNK